MKPLTRKIMPVAAHSVRHSGDMQVAHTVRRYTW